MIITGESLASSMTEFILIFSFSLFTLGMLTITMNFFKIKRRREK